MNAPVSWQEGNARYLAAATSWLRLLLDQAADAGSLKAQASGSALREMEFCESLMDPPPAMTVLAQRFGLSTFERQVLLLCVAMELDTGSADRCARAQGTPARPYPTFALALALFDDAAWDAMSPERPLRLWRLIDIHQGTAQPLTTSPLRADERIVNFVKGLNHLDERLLPLLTPMSNIDDDSGLQASQQAVVEQIVGAWAAQPPGARWSAVQLLGPDASSKRLIAQHAAARYGRHLQCIASPLLPTSQSELDTFARLWQRECVLSPVALYIEHPDDGTATAASAALGRFLARTDGLNFIDSRDLLKDLGRAHLAVEVSKPTTAEQRAAWHLVLGDEAGALAPSLSSQFNLNVGSIHRLGNAARQRAGGADVDPIDLWDACRASVCPGLNALAQRIDAKATWDDIVLPDEPLELLRQISAQVRCRGRVYQDWGFARKMNRGLGISALFDGPGGVGKTMAAEVIANDLRLDLYRIDLSSVISKYVGETEGNLRRVFDAAEDGGAILFFDECDALFGKRSEVKDSHDRYNNILTNYLLQRIESYQGLAILATNMKSALDTAFVRRLRFIIEFPFPVPEQRQLIWQKAFPPGVPCAGLDLERLGRMNLAGGGIHAAALGAAFMAAQAGTAVTMQCVLAAVRNEFHKLGRPANGADFRLLGERGVAA
ncbi:MAG: ATP-binding protein [Leptothrix sp. (in: b-proteobacteria)]